MRMTCLRRNRTVNDVVPQWAAVDACQPLAWSHITPFMTNNAKACPVRSTFAPAANDAAVLPAMGVLA